MNLTEEQMSQVRAWIDEGLKVAEIQTRLNEVLGIRMTYMEARLLLDDLKLKPKDPPAAPRPSDSVLGGAGTPNAPQGGPGGMPMPSETPGTGGRVSVTVDQIARPGAVVSGKVTFRDGQSAEWQLDQLGRLGVVPSKQGYRPSQADVVDFQAELDSVLARMGF